MAAATQVKLAGLARGGPAAPLAECPHRPPCPGCPRYGQAGLAPAPEEELRSFCRRYGVPVFEVLEGTAWGYRHRARLAVRGSAEAPEIGIFQEGTHEVVAVPDCPIHHPLINRVARALAASLRRTRTTVYRERTHSGLVRYLQVVVERASQTAQVAVIANAERAEACRALFTELGERLGPLLHSLHFNGQSARSNSIVGPNWQVVAGPPAVSERLGGARVWFPPGAFGQANLDLFSQIVERIHLGVESGARVVELYAGVGAIGLGLCARGHSVVFNEVNPAGLHGLELGLAELDESARARATLVAGPAERAAPTLELAGAHVIVDPPRKGLGRETRALLAAAPAARLTYLSCGLPSFLEDAEALLAGGWRCESIQAHALFPFTEHVETLAHFARAGGDPRG